MKDREISLDELFEKDRVVWNDCAEQYEQSIVMGHPDIIAFEDFEEDFFDRLLLYLMRDKGLDIMLSDVGCGSARLHLHYGLKSIKTSMLSRADADLVRRIRRKHARHQFDPHFSKHLKQIHGLDFSSEMITLAKEKVSRAGMGSLLGERLVLEEASAYDMPAFEEEPVPFVVNVCNSIGVMQGEKGAIALFKSLRRTVESAGGIAVISCYRQKAVESFALGNYESTMNVSGQPKWLKPDTYAGSDYLKVPRYFKRAHDSSDSIIVDVYDSEGKLVKEGFELQRDPEAVKYTLETGHIRMHSDYESHWYSFEQFDEWIEEFWSGSQAYHLAGNAIDCVRAQPVQIAVYDPANRLEELFNSWWQ